MGRLFWKVVKVLVAGYWDVLKKLAILWIKNLLGQARQLALIVLACVVLGLFFYLMGRC